MHRLIAFCVFLATAAEALPSFAGNAAWSKMADSTHNNMMYFVETKQELFVIGGEPDLLSKTWPIINTRVPTISYSAPTTRTNASTTSTSTQTTTTSAPTDTTSAPTDTTSAPTTTAPTDTTSAPTSTTTAPTDTTSAPTTTTTAPTDTTSAPTTTTTTPTDTTSAPTSTTTAPTDTTSAPTSTITAPADTTSAPTNTTPFTFPPGYTYSSETGSFYKYHKEQLYWYEANTTCANEGSYLVIINDEVEAAVIGEIIRAADEWWTWTGVRDKRPGGVSDWRSIHGEPISQLYHNWFVNRPLVYAGCAAMFVTELKFFDFYASTQLPFTCEISQ